MPVIEQLSEWLVVGYNGANVQVSPTLGVDCLGPEFPYGSSVCARPPRSLQTGIVARIQWHFKNNEPMYFLQVDGRDHKSSYFSHELSAT